MGNTKDKRMSHTVSSSEGDGSEGGLEEGEKKAPSQHEEGLNDTDSEEEDQMGKKEKSGF